MIICKIRGIKNEELNLVQPIASCSWQITPRLLTRKLKYYEIIKNSKMLYWEQEMIVALNWKKKKKNLWRRWEKLGNMKGNNRLEI